MWRAMFRCTNVAQFNDLNVHGVLNCNQCDWNTVTNHLTVVWITKITLRQKSAVNAHEL